ncbi:molybdate transport system ATP-binding component [Klebsiella pneumoniae]|uniref:Molybdate transport system ATP-binding component n=1 Tax=Klebsiella pneumoniae TaxID=573 RepID=A0A377TPD5_KLEPN|nr:molybdate transport system ATP-binding component [Klebsiella pneumoniae]
MTDPQLLILDEPFDGLDVNSRQQLAALLADLHSAGITLVLVLNRFDEIPEFVQFAGVLADCTLSETGEKSSLLQQALVAQLAHSEKLDGITLPEPDVHRPVMRWQTRRRVSCSTTAWSPITIARSSITSHGP